MAYIIYKWWFKPPIVSSIMFYPIKSAAGIRVQRAIIGEYGILYDREFSLYDPVERMIVSQREDTGILKIHPELVLDSETDELK